MPYQSTKTYGHEVGLSACFRQWRADSHCQYLHGYALSVSLVFEADTLDANNWVVDFGSLKPIKAWLQDTFDHTTLVAEDDPDFDQMLVLKRRHLIQFVGVPATGCEAFAELIYKHVSNWLGTAYKPNVVGVHATAPHVRLMSVEVREHGADSALYLRGKL